MVELTAFVLARAESTSNISHRNERVLDGIGLDAAPSAGKDNLASGGMVSTRNHPAFSKSKERAHSRSLKALPLSHIFNTGAPLVLVTEASSSHSLVVS